MPRVVVSPAQSRALAMHGLENGGRVLNPISSTWDVSGRCERPIAIEFAGRLRNKLSYYVDLEVPCRKCRACLGARRWLWGQRAKVEHAAAVRTWFGTLTMRPEEHFKAVASFDAGGGDFRKLSADQRFAVRHRYHSRQITLFLKRLRKQGGGKYRYLFVAEKHKNDLPHYHCLIHEVDDNCVSKRELHALWWHGFSAWKLVAEDRQLSYVVKYLSKDSCARLRASIRYGTASLGGKKEFPPIPPGVGGNVLAAPTLL